MQVGEEFCGSKSEVLQESIKRQSVNYFKNYHRQDVFAASRSLPWGLDPPSNLSQSQWDLVVCRQLDGECADLAARSPDVYERNPLRTMVDSVTETFTSNRNRARTESICNYTVKLPELEAHLPLDYVAPCLTHDYVCSQADSDPSSDVIRIDQCCN